MPAILTKTGQVTRGLFSRPANLAELIEQLGDIPLDRIVADPPPGTATEADLLKLTESREGLFELVDGTIVEKPMGFKEGRIEAWILHLLHKYLEGNNIGELSSGSGTLRLRKGLVRAPDVTFCLWENAPTDEEEDENAITDTVPDLAVEVVSRTNTPKELARKRKEYFKAGTTLVWQVYPKTRTVEVYTSPTRFRTLTLADTLDGGKLMPGLQIPLKRLFGRRTKPSRRAE